MYFQASGHSIANGLHAAGLAGFGTSAIPFGVADDDDVQNGLDVRLQVGAVVSRINIV